MSRSMLSYVDIAMKDGGRLSTVSHLIQNLQIYEFETAKELDILRSRNLKVVEAKRQREINVNK